MHSVSLASLMSGQGSITLGCAPALQLPWGHWTPRLARWNTKVRIANVFCPISCSESEWLKFPTHSPTLSFCRWLQGKALSVHPPHRQGGGRRRDVLFGRVNPCSVEKAAWYLGNQGVQRGLRNIASPTESHPVSHTTQFLTPESAEPTDISLEGTRPRGN